MKRVLCAALVICILICNVTGAFADSLNLTKITTRSTFSYDDDENTTWTYYQYAEKYLSDGTYVEFLVVDWGNNTELSGYPEFRVFATTKTYEEIIVQSATFMIDGNMFEVSFDELELEQSRGACFYMTSDSQPFMRSLAAAQSVSAILHHANGTLTVSFTASEFAPIRQFAYDLISIDFLHHVADEESAYESVYQELSPITSYVFTEVDLEVQPEGEQSLPHVNDTEWREYTLQELGLMISLPANYTVYTRDMSDTDPILIASGLSSTQLDQIFVDSNLFLEATPDNFNSEIMVTMVGSTISDFSIWSDNSLLAMSSLWTSAYADYGIEILDTDILSCNNIKYIRMHERQTVNGSISYRIQYYTTTNYQAVNLIFVSVGDDVTEAETEFMQTVVERTIFSGDIAASEINTFSQDASNFSYSVLDNGNACITGYSGMSGSVAIPESIDGYPVTSLAVMEDNGLVSNVYIPDSVILLEGNPFAEWKSLRTITVSDSHPRFSAEDGILFSLDKSKLISYPRKHAGDEYSVPANVTCIGKEAFSGAGDLLQVTLPEGLIEIGDNAFFALDSVPNISIPSTVTTIGINPFYGMYRLEEIRVSPGNKTFTVQQGALYNRKTNTLVAFPRRYVTSAFAFRNGITSIGDYAFWNNDSAFHIDFPDSVSYIGDSAFCGCKNMSFSELPVGIRTIGPAAFMSTSIMSVTLPSTIQSVGRACFAASNLTEVTVMPGITELAPVMFSGCKVTRLALPETVTTIGELAFVNCDELIEVNIPSSVVYMGNDVFKNCPNVKVSVVKGSYGETYCKQNGIPYGYCEADVSSGKIAREYVLQAGPFTVTLDDSRYNILVPGMTLSEPAVFRCGIPADMVDAYMSMQNLNLLMFGIDERVPPKFDISIRIKDNKYEGVDLRRCSAVEATSLLNVIYGSFSTTATDKEIVTINGVPYLKFNWMNGTQLRYVTIVNGDMIYIWATRDDGNINAEDAALLLDVVESVMYPQ